MENYLIAEEFRPEEHPEANITVTLAEVEGAIKSIEYQKLGRKTCLCFVTLNSGFEIVASSSCVNPEKYNDQIGQELALKRAKDKVWELLGYCKQVTGMIFERVPSYDLNLEESLGE